MVRKQTLPIFEVFFQLLKNALDETADRKDVTRDSYFADKLGFKSQSKESQFNQLLNPRGKDLTVRELIVLLKIMKEDSLSVLEYLADKANLTVARKADPNSQLEQIEHTLMGMSVDSGLLNVTYLKALEDNNLDIDEIDSLKQLSTSSRGRLVHFEFMLDEYKKGLSDEKN